LKKVTGFLARITDSSLGNRLSFVYGNLNLLANFDSCQKYLQTIAASTRIHQMLQKGKERDIDAVGEDKGRGKVRGKRQGKPAVRHQKYILPEKWKKLRQEERLAVFQKQETDDANGKWYQKKEKKPDKEKKEGHTSSSTNTADEKSDPAEDTK
jgi:hypothetical protein